MKPWIGIDLDGTLARYEYYPETFTPEMIGEPIPAMLERAKKMLDDGIDVRIITARVGPHDEAYPDGRRIDTEWVARSRAAIEAWCIKHFGRVLPITATKDYAMVAFYDDRAIQIVHNAGVRADGLPL